MPAIRRSALLALATLLTASGAEALPEPAYRTADQSQDQTAATAAQTLDRYGGGDHRARASAPAPAAAGGGRYLAWADKADVSPQAAQLQPVAPIQPSATGSAWRPYRPQAQAPASIYDAPQPAAPSAQTQAQLQPVQAQGGPRFYSVHREYGLAPDAIPIPPQFFGPTADLSAPPADPALKRTTTASGQIRTTAIPSADDQSMQ